MIEELNINKYARNPTGTENKNQIVADPLIFRAKHFLNKQQSAFNSDYNIYTKYVLF